MTFLGQTRFMENSILPPDTVRKCITVICDECGYASLDELGEMLGIEKNPRAVVSSWQTRNSYGRSGDIKLHDLTGASLTWLNGRGGIPFPDGPKLSPALKMARIYGEIREIRSIFIAFARASAKTRQELAKAWGAELLAEKGTLFRALVLDALGIHPSSEASQPIAQVVQSHAKPVHKKRKPHRA